MARVVFDDGTEVTNIPDGASEGEVENILATKIPYKMLELGIGYDLEKEYNIRDGVPDVEA